MQKFTISGKTVFNAGKISLGCVLSMIAATVLGLKYSATAGLITILSIQQTKKETVITALKRLSAFFCAVVISVLCFNLLGYTTLAFGVYLFIFVMLCMILDWQIATVPISVLITHLLAEKSCHISILLNEFLIFVIGAGVGTIINMHLHNNKQKMNSSREKLDNEIKAILERMSQRILTDDKSDYNSDCFKKIDKLLFEARQVAYENQNNKLIGAESYDIDYLKMRENQCSVLMEMYKSILKISVTPEQSKVISEFLKKTSSEFHEKNDVKNLISELEDIFADMRFQKMPESRTEFENRAVLFSLMLQIKDFLSIKYDFMEKRDSQRS
ncbi:MAG: aromatic acid exporter family protein [Oscillospiraceae bacterium]|nr:aromatic acid exporter family protein [Oscillospiraceae bacterium]